MVVVLEKLVAKGRRVHHARDQREVAFGLAALSTKKEIHFNILKKGGVKTLTHLLKSSSDVEAQRFASLALANTACIENYKSDFVREDECLDGILSELRNDDADLVVRRYCAMALGNLASDPETHIEISDRGGLFAVTHFLKVVAKEKELEAGRCVTLAISNLAINPSHRRRFIQYGAIENLIYISCWDDWAVKCKALVALRAICLSYELRIVVLNAGVIDPLVIISRSDNVSVLREVAAMFNCLSAVTEKKNEISDRALSTITALLFAHDSVIEFHASCTIANLTEEHATHHRFLTESGPSHILALNQNCRVDSKGEVMRTLSNLSKNKESRSHLLSTDVFKAAVEALDTSDVNCQKFAAALLANLTADDVSHALIIREGVLCPLIHMICEGSASMEAQRYAALTLANISSTRESHDVIYKAQGIEALLKLSKSADTFSQKNVACTYANFARYADIHSYILKKGIIQSITFLMQNRDSDIRLYLSAALRGMSTNTNTSIKIVQEGGLEILLPLLSSNDILILRNVTACLYNLSIMTENKLEISQLGCIPLLIRLIEHDDSDVSCNCCACLSNISEMSCYRGSIASEGGIKASMMAMHSKFLELQRKSGRLFSLLCGCNISRILDEIIQNEGHRFLISYLTSHDSYVIHSGLIGILNLSAHKEHRVDITKARVLAPLLNIITEDLDSDLQKMAMMSIVNLSDDTDNHLTFMKEGILDAMISLYNSPVCEMKAYAALVVANIAKNVSMGQRISCCRGGVESILDLARMDHSPFRKTILGAIASLSFIKKNREQICFRGGIKQLLEDFRTESKDSSSFNFMCCAVANLSENAEHNAFLAEIGVVPLLTNILTSYEFEDINEAIRALGNLAIDPQLCLDISQNDHVICKVLRFISKGNEFAVRMAYMMMTNVAANIKTHDYLLRVDIMSPIVKYLKNALNPKLKDSDETISYALLLVANLWANKDTHNMIAENVIDMVVQYTKHRDIRCRQNAVICLGNLSSIPDTIRRCKMTEVPKIFISFAYTPSHNETSYAQFQAIAGIRGLAFHHDLRSTLVREGCCEPLVLALNQEKEKKTNVPLNREASAAIFNLTLSSDTYLLLPQPSIVSGLLRLIGRRDTISQPYAIGSLANLARHGYDGKVNLFAEIEPPMFRNILQSFSLSDETRKELSRCLVHFSRDVRCRQLFERQYELLERTLTNLVTNDEIVSCQINSLLTYANLVTNLEQNHSFFLPSFWTNVHQLMTTANTCWIGRCVAFTLNTICQRTMTHNTCKNYRVAQLLIRVLSLEDEISNRHACIALKHFSVQTKGATTFVEYGGLVILSIILNNDKLDLRLEALACLRNLSIPEVNKAHLRRKGIIPKLMYLMQFTDTEVAHHACSVVANLAECDECLQEIIDGGILHQLKISLGSHCRDFDREALRLLSTISSGFMCTCLADNFSLLKVLTQFQFSESKFCRRYAYMSIANLLALNKETRLRLVETGLIHSLVSEIRQGQDEQTKKYALIALSNISEAKQFHSMLRHNNVIQLANDFLSKDGEDFTYSAALCLSNLASNVENHVMLHGAGSLDRIKLFLNGSRTLHLRALSFVRGASTSGVMMKDLHHPDISTHLLVHASIEDRELQIEVISSLCNMSLSGIIGNDTKYFFEYIDMKILVTLLCDTESALCLFAAIMIGNISSDFDLQEVIVASGALGTILRTVNKLDSESRRCIAYALCNLSCSNSNGRTKIMCSDTGLSSIFSLGYLGNENDLYISSSAIRELSSFSDFRKAIVDKKGLDYLLHVYENYGNPESLHEAVEALCWLSLDDDNKVHIVQHKILQLVCRMALFDKNEISSLSLRTLANCCEVESLHESLIKYMDEKFFQKLFTAGIGKHDMELSRFICNISSVRDYHAHLLSTDHMMNIILELSTRDCSVVATNAVMAFLNFSANRGIHEKLCASADKIVQRVFRIFEYLTRATEVHYFICISVACLLVNHTFHELFSGYGLRDLLIKLLENGNDRMKFQATFAFHLFVRKREGILYFKDDHPDSCLISVITGLDAKLSFHAMCSLRYLSAEPDIARHIVKINGLEAINHASYLADDDLRREICHLLFHLSSIPDLKSSILQSDAFLSMIRMLERPSKCSCLTLTALANCLEDPSSLKHVPCIENTVKMVIKRLTDNVLCMKREAYRALANLLSCQKVMAIATSLNVFKIISSSGISCIDNSIKLCITASLRKFSVVSSHHEFILHHEEVMKMICHFCHRRHNKDIIIHAGNALKNLATHHQTKELIATKGGTTAAFNLIKHECEEINVIAVAILYHLSFVSKIKYQLYKQGILSLVGNLISIASVIDTSCYASLLLCNLAEHTEVRGFMWHENVISGLKKLGSLDSTISLLGVSRCILFMSMTANVATHRNSVQELMAIARKLLLSESRLIANNAAVIVGNFAEYRQCHAAIKDSKILEPLLNLVQTTKDYHDDSLVSCWALSKILACIGKENAIYHNSSALLRCLTHCVLSERNANGYSFGSMLLCNLSAVNSTHEEFVKTKWIPILFSLLQTTCSLTSEITLKTICNLSKSDAIKKEFVKCNNVIEILLDLGKKDIKHHALVAFILSEIVISQECKEPLIASGGLDHFTKIICESKEPDTAEACWIFFYHMSKNYDYHRYLVDMSVLGAMYEMLKDGQERGKLMALMTFCNLVANDTVRRTLLRSGAFDFALSFMNKNTCPIVMSYGTILIGNLACNLDSEHQLYLHRALPLMLTLLSREHYIIRRTAIVSTVNMTFHSTNLSIELNYDIVVALRELGRNADFLDLLPYISFSLANLTSNRNMLEFIGENSGVKFIANMITSSNNFYSRWVGLSAIKKLTQTRSNRGRISTCMVLDAVMSDVNLKDGFIRNDLSQCLLNLSKDNDKRPVLAKVCMPGLILLLGTEDLDTLIKTCDTIAFITESDDCISLDIKRHVMDCIVPLLEHDNLYVRRASSRLMSNLLSFNTIQIQWNQLSKLLKMCYDQDWECRRYASSVCSKLAVTKKSHHLLIKNLEGLIYLTQSKDEETNRNAILAIQELSTEKINRAHLVEGCVVQTLTNFILHKDHNIQVAVLSTLDNLSSCPAVLHRIMSADLMIKLKTLMVTASYDLWLILVRLTANLSEEYGNRFEMINEGIVSAALVVSKSTCPSIQENLSRLLVNLLAYRDTQFDVYRQGALESLINLTSVSNSTDLCIEYMSIGIQLLCSNSDVRHAIMNENRLAPIIELFSHASVQYMHCTVVTLCLMSVDEESRTSLLIMLGSLFDLLEKGTIQIQGTAICAIANLAESAETHESLVNMFVVKRISSLVSNATDSKIVQEISRLLAFMSINDTAKEHILAQELLPYLIKFSRRTDKSTQRYSTLAICHLALHPARQGFYHNHDVLRVLIFLTKCHDLEVERCSFLSLAILCFGVESDYKELIANDLIFNEILKGIYHEHIPIKQSSSLVLSSILLNNSDSIKRKWQTIDHEYSTILSLFQVSDDLCVHNAIYAVGSLVEIPNFRHDLIEMGCISFVLKVLRSTSCVDTKRACAYVFSVIYEYSEYHSHLKNNSNDMRVMVDLLESVDCQCKIYGILISILLASNSDLQVSLVKLGAVRHLSSIIEIEAELYPYAGLALLKLADNFENHIAFSEEGGIRALLKLGAIGSMALGDKQNLRSSLSLAKLASNAVKAFKQVTPASQISSSSSIQIDEINIS